MVPLTLQVEAMHPAFYTHSVRPLSRYGAKVGSLQKWVAHDDCASDRGAQTFPKEEVHKIAILDMRILNTDRNDANVLVKDPPKLRGGKRGGGGGFGEPPSSSRMISVGGGSLSLTHSLSLLLSLPLVPLFCLRDQARGSTLRGFLSLVERLQAAIRRYQ